MSNTDGAMSSATKKRNAEPLAPNFSPRQLGVGDNGSPSKRWNDLIVENDNAEQQQPLDEIPIPLLGNIVTPGSRRGCLYHDDNPLKMNVRRELFPTPGVRRPIPVTPAPPRHAESSEPTAKRRLIFGRMVDEIVVQDNVRKVYRIIHKLTGAIGGNASHGPIYGELTMGSMQKMVNLMKEHANFDNTCRFIDVGSGIGKPNLHVAQDPGVEISYGIEVEFDRWLLGMNCLKGVLDAAHSEQTSESVLKVGEKILHRCIFDRADIRSAKCFDPFTHVYMFSIGFPPKLWMDLSVMWNNSHSPYLICYHGPRDIIGNYEFNVELIAQTPTSMHGSKEGHTGYIYRRPGPAEARRVAGDPVFNNAFGRLERGLDSLREEVTVELREVMGSGPSTRKRRRIQAASGAK